MTQPPPIRAKTPRGPATSEERWAGGFFYCESFEELADRYGSATAAGDRYRELRERGEIEYDKIMPLVRPSIWWKTTEGVPPDLRELPAGGPPPHSRWVSRAEREALGWTKVEDRRRAWLRDSGHASAEEIRRYDGHPYRHLRNHEEDR